MTSTISAGATGLPKSKPAHATAAEPKREPYAVDELDRAVDFLRTAWIAMQGCEIIESFALSSIAATVDAATEIVTSTRDRLNARAADAYPDLPILDAWVKYKKLYRELAAGKRPEAEIYSDMSPHEKTIQFTPAVSITGLLAKAEFMCAQVCSSSAAANALINGLPRPDDGECDKWPNSLAWSVVEDLRAMRL